MTYAKNVESIYFTSSILTAASLATSERPSVFVIPYRRIKAFTRIARSLGFIPVVFDTMICLMSALIVISDTP
ncbi:MAG: hypothetical protein MUO73_01980 [Thermoplasmata archaeon]|nr:hypothetical protein [Thermoplasmata archaeon]